VLLQKRWWGYGDGLSNGNGKNILRKTVSKFSEIILPNPGKLFYGGWMSVRLKLVFYIICRGRGGRGIIVGI